MKSIIDFIKFSKEKTITKKRTVAVRRISIGHFRAKLRNVLSAPDPVVLSNGAHAWSRPRAIVLIVPPGYPYIFAGFAAAKKKLREFLRAAIEEIQPK